METTDNIQPKHIGYNIKRVRESVGIKQEVLAMELGDDWTQKKVSLLEQKEIVDEGLLQQVAKVLNVPVNVIKNYSDEGVINYFNSFSDNSVNNGAVYAFNSTFNPLEKMVELYEALLKSEREKNALLERLLEKK